MQSAFDLLTPSTLYAIIKSNSTKLLERGTAKFYLALGEKTPRRRIAADIAMRKHGVAQAQTKCPSAHKMDYLIFSAMRMRHLFCTIPYENNKNSTRGLSLKMSVFARARAQLSKMLYISTHLSAPDGENN